MPKLVDSMLKVFKREKKGPRVLDKKNSRFRGDNRSVLDGDFIFMPGNTESQFWGEILNDDNYPLSQLREVEETQDRRKTHIGLVASDVPTEVKVIISPSVQEKEDNVVMNGKLFNRRLSGTLVKARKSDLVEDEPVIRDYAFLLSARERLSQEISGRYVYDRLVRPPLQTKDSLKSSTKPAPMHARDPQATLSPQWSFPGDTGPRESLSNDRRMSYGKEEVVLRRPGHLSSVPSKDSVLFGVNRGQLTCSVRDTHNTHNSKGHSSLRVGQRSPVRLSAVDSDNQAYSNLDFSRSVVGSEYAMPADALDWEKEELESYEVVAMREYRTIPPQDLMLGEKIGEGQFGDVHNGYLYPKTMDEIDVAIKTCKADASSEDKDKFLEEASVMCKFKHPNIIKLFGVVSHRDLAYIVMELAPHGQLRRYLLMEGSRITRLMLLSYIAQLASAMVHLEDMNYVHRDIAARNILVCSPQSVKLADFGLSRGLEDGDYYVASRGKLPIKWMAPESINFRRFTGLSDVWMFGVCCWEILMRGVKPFVGIKNDEVICKIESGERLALPKECPAPLYSLMNMCWKYDPLERPRFVEIEARLLEIIDEEMQVDQMSTRRYNSGMIQPDPEAPPKPDRDRHAAATPPMARVGSGNAVGGGRMYGGGLHSNDPQLSMHAAMEMDRRREDHLPPLPPRAMERFRDVSTSPPNGVSGSPTPPTRNLPQSHPPNHEGRHMNHTLPPHPHGHVVPPYSITTLSPAAEAERFPRQTTPDSPTPVHSHVIRPESPLGGFRNSYIPPPAILSQHPSHQRGGAEGGIYYSTPEIEVTERKQQRVLTKEGVFVSRDVRSPQGSLESDRDHGVRPKLGEGRPVSRVSTGESSGMSSPALLDETVRSPSHNEDSFAVPDEDDILKMTMGVVKTVKELSDKVHKSKPNDYVELVKSVGLALRDLLGKVDQTLNDLPQETHTEVEMAQKVLSSDMNQLVSSMKDAQLHYDKFLEQEYQKKMLKSAHVVAVNSKLLLDAVNSAKRKAHLMR